MIRKIAKYTLLGMLLALAPGVHMALATEAEKPADVRLVAAVLAHDNAPVQLGLAIDLAPGWKTYWRNPGDSGIAPKFDWSGSKNIRSTEVRWPAPTRFDLAGETIYGYEGNVVLPVLVRILNPAKKLHLELMLDYAVCANLCVPLSAKLAIDIPAGRPKVSGDAPLIQHYLSNVPRSPRNQASIRLVFESKSHPRLLVTCAECAKSTSLPALIVDGPPGAWFGIPKASRKAATVLYEVPIEFDPGFSLSGKKLNLVFAGSNGAIEVERHLP